MLLRCPVDLPALDAPSSSVCSAVPSQDRLPCASLPISQRDCGARGCCYEPRDRMMPCYFGNTGKPEASVLPPSLPPELLQNRSSHFAGRASQHLVCQQVAQGYVFACQEYHVPVKCPVFSTVLQQTWFYAQDCLTAHCTPDGQFSIAVSQDVTLPPIPLDSVQPASGHGTSCVPVLTNNAFVVYQFPLYACGTTFQDAYSCFFLLLNGSWISSVPDGSYTSYYTDSDYPVVKTLRDPVYAEVKILQRTDPNLILVLHHCWATPSINPQEQQQWPILVDRCPYAGDNYQTQLMPLSFTSGLLLPSHYQRFTLHTFTFMNPTSHEKLFGLVYLHCSASVCHRSLKESCITPCPPRVSKCPGLLLLIQRGSKGLVSKLGRRHVAYGEGTSHVSSKGPVIFLQDELRQDTAKDGLGVAVHAAAPWALGFTAVATGTALCVVLSFLCCGKRCQPCMKSLHCNKVTVKPI
ncbi:Zona pellucida sperm-binding protein 4 [Lonchura striata]|uniref:Zona pellucida sperm-binding protein 4 n=1 Tax=Lonchura striata TaxID=40157 RepID=A0A218UW44_9PASE|nr:Zona pellucida sperm-binding protein 4 [Lonchura striata domestica]